ncbi:MAG: hypothetical protein GF335_03935 [Candidatus Moranbacteria bacterium]|nr:hypothetical protein [Candidatus Moranbacteria bacterium]
MKCDDNFGNLIKHISDEDGTLRSAKACYIIKEFNPDNATELAEIILNNINRNSDTIYHARVPMFYNNKKLVKYVESFTASRWINYHITKLDTIDLPADMCKLSPKFKKRYPGDKWHDAVREFESRLHKEGVW